MVYIEVHRPGGLETFQLAGERCTLGKGGEVDLDLSQDGTVSRLHAAFEPYGTQWCVRDLGSRNGTFVNDERIWTERVLHDKDDIRVGQTRLVFRSMAGESLTRTRSPSPPPEVTRREKEILVALCRPPYKGDYFTEPASVKAIAKELFITEAAVKQHLSRLYDKFGVFEGERRVRLANEAMRSGAVTLNDLRQDPPGRRLDGEDSGQ